MLWKWLKKWTIFSLKHSMENIAPESYPTHDSRKSLLNDVSNMPTCSTALRVKNFGVPYMPKKLTHHTCFTYQKIDIRVIQQRVTNLYDKKYKAVRKRATWNDMNYGPYDYEIYCSSKLVYHYFTLAHKRTEAQKKPI